MIDLKIQWNSLHFMLERFDKVKNCILKSLIDLGSSISFDKVELNMIHNLVTTLEPVKLAVEALCRRDTSLLSSADTTISFMINSLGKSDLAVQLKKSLSRRMNQRRTKVYSLLQYLHKGNQNYVELEVDPLHFERLSKVTIDSMVTGLSKPLDHNEPFELKSDNEAA
jgi:predicted house-cleaning NTP pyrophosphatase (Maf/HAM1 superfamily)